jgi:tetrahydromethanopterin S-methyltransferase subunit B
MEGRLTNALEGLIFGLAFAVIAWVIAFKQLILFAKKIVKFRFH